jgi:hypothetical protein
LTDRTLPPRRRWLAIMVATLIAVVSYWSIVFAFVVNDLEGTEIELDTSVSAGGPFALGLGVAPFAFLVLAFMSNNPSAPGATLRAMALSIPAAIAFGLFGIPVGLVAGFGFGGVLALRLDSVHQLKLRWISVFGAVVYTFVVGLISPQAALFAGGFIPFAASGLADMISEYQAEQAAGD